MSLQEHIDEDMIKSINHMQENTMLIRENIFDRQRVLSGILQREQFPSDVYSRIQLMMRDVNSAHLARRFQFRASGLSSRHGARTYQHRAEQHRQDIHRGFGIFHACHARGKHLRNERGSAFRYIPVGILAYGDSHGSPSRDLR